jgi:hypothetical protein
MITLGFMLPCLNKAIFGIDCPGCGAQRALLMILQGDFASAFFMYPAIYTLILFGCVLILSQFYSVHSKVIYGLGAVNVLTIAISYTIKMSQFN